MQTFQIKRLADAVREQTLDNLITELLLWLLDERVSMMDDGSQLLKALNVLMLKILVSCSFYLFFYFFCFPFPPFKGDAAIKLVLVPFKLPFVAQYTFFFDCSFFKLACLFECSNVQCYHYQPSFFFFFSLLLKNYLVFYFNKFHLLFYQDNAERTSSFVVLINLLRPLDPARWPALTPPEALPTKNQKFSDLVVKCLIKLTKVHSFVYDTAYYLSLRLGSYY